MTLSAQGAKINKDYPNGLSLRRRTSHQNQKICNPQYKQLQGSEQIERCIRNHDSNFCIFTFQQCSHNTTAKQRLNKETAVSRNFIHNSNRTHNFIHRTNLYKNITNPHTLIYHTLMDLLLTYNIFTW